LVIFRVFSTLLILVLISLLPAIMTLYISKRYLI
jgi:hypothetical protein